MKQRGAGGRKEGVYVEKTSTLTYFDAISERTFLCPARRWIGSIDGVVEPVVDLPASSS